MNFNKVILLGRITQDIELKNSNNQTPYINFSIALNETKNNITNTNYIKCIAFNETAKYLSKYSNKGTLILVDGKLKITNFTDKDNIKREKIEVVLDSAKIILKQQEIQNIKTQNTTNIKSYSGENNEQFIKRLNENINQEDLLRELGVNINNLF